MDDMRELAAQLLEQEHKLLAILGAAELNPEKYGEAIERGMIELNRVENVLETLFGKQKPVGEN
jgi:hypothetical protein